jgi:hypothetical protein
MVRRHPNHLWAQLAEDRLAASLIADGHHLPADTFAVMLRAKGVDRVVLVSDSVALTGCPPGGYITPVGGAVTVHPDGRLTLTGSELLAGSGRDLLDCVEWATTAAGLDLPTASRLAATNPARLLGLTDRGAITPAPTRTSSPSPASRPAAWSTRAPTCGASSSRVDRNTTVSTRGLSPETEPRADVPAGRNPYLQRYQQHHWR